MLSNSWALIHSRPSTYENSHVIWDHTERGDVSAITPAEAGTRFINPGGMKGWVDLSQLVWIFCTRILRDEQETAAWTRTLRFRHHEPSTLALRHRARLELFYSDKIFNFSSGLDAHEMRIHQFKKNYIVSYASLRMHVQIFSLIARKSGAIKSLRGNPVAPMYYPEFWGEISTDDDR